MKKDVKKNNLAQLAINQNLLLWQLTKSLLDIDKKITDTIKSTKIS